jgi:hypothetical protein
MSPDARHALTDLADAIHHWHAAQAAADFTAQGQALADLDAAVKRFNTALNTDTPAPSR